MGGESSNDFLGGKILVGLSLRVFYIVFFSRVFVGFFLEISSLCSCVAMGFSTSGDFSGPLETKGDNVAKGQLRARSPSPEEFYYLILQNGIKGSASE